jgi:hypothetical protein
MSQSSLYEENILLLEEPQRQKWETIENTLNAGCNKQQLQRFAETFISWLGKYTKVYKQDAKGNIKEAEELTAMLKSTSSKYVIAEGVALILASKDNLQHYVHSLNPKMQELWQTILLYGYVSHDRAKQILGIKSNLFDTNRSYYYYSSSSTWNKREYGWWITSHLRSRKKLDFGYLSYDDFITVSNAIRGIFFPIFFPQLQQPDNSLETLPVVGNASQRSVVGNASQRSVVGEASQRSVVGNASQRSVVGEASQRSVVGETSQLCKEYRTIEFETESLSAFNLFCGLFKQGELPMKKKGITVADMKRANKKLALSEFFPGDTNEFRQYLRAYNYMGILALNEHLKSKYKAKKVLSYPDTLLNLVKDFDKFDHYLPSLLYPHIKGLRQNQTQWGNHDKLCKYMIEWLRDHPHNWVSIIEIYMRIVQLGSDGNSNIYTALVYNPNEEQNTAEITNLYSLETIDADSYASQFGYTGLQSFAFILASLGIAEIALAAAPDGSPSGFTQMRTPFHSLEYIRLTPLGRYALGNTKEYEIPKIEQQAYFELDPQRLIIRSLQDPNPYEQLLRDTAMPISRGRFQTSALSFLTNCHSRDDVEGKINIFKQFISNELPPLWQQFFQSLLQHCHPLTEDKTCYHHYTLQPDNHDLIHLITTDPVLRQIVIRAEGYRILVKYEDIRKFETQLKKHGYLL